MGSNRQDSKIRTLKAIGMACITLSVFLLSGCGNKRDGLTITNVSYDPTREFYEEYNEAFADYYSDSNVPKELLCLLMRNEYIYSLDYDKRPVADPDFDTQLAKAIEVIKSGITVEEVNNNKKDGEVEVQNL